MSAPTDIPKRVWIVAALTIAIAATTAIVAVFVWDDWWHVWFVVVILGTPAFVLANRFRSRAGGS